MWNWKGTYGPFPELSRKAVLDGGLQAVHMKMQDGGQVYPSSWDVRRQMVILRAEPVLSVGGWGYYYFKQPEVEIARTLMCIKVFTPDYWVFNIEDPAIERNPNTPAIARKLFRSVKAARPELPLYFCSHAQPTYHQAQPYYQALVEGLIMMPMVYWTAMEMDPVTALVTSLRQYQDYGLAYNGILPCACTYSTPSYDWVPNDARRFGIGAVERGALGVSWWSLDDLVTHVDDASVLAETPLPAPV